jgi:hypothetical protein
MKNLQATFSVVAGVGLAGWSLYLGISGLLSGQVARAGRLVPVSRLLSPGSYWFSECFWLLLGGALLAMLLSIVWALLTRHS